MTSKNLKEILKYVRDLIKHERPAYKDYLGEETIIATNLICEGTFVDISEEASILTQKDSSFTGFNPNETYDIIIDGISQNAMAKTTTQGENTYNYLSNVTYEEINEKVFINGESLDFYLIIYNNGVIMSMSCGEYVGKSVSVSQTKTVTNKKYDIKLLNEELLPKTVAKKSEVTSAIKVVEDKVKSDVDTVSSEAFTAKNAADAAQSTADTALGLANNAVSNIQYGGTIYWDGNTESKPHIYWSSKDFYRVSDLYIPYDQFNGSYNDSNSNSYTINKLKLVNEAYYVRKSSSDVFAILIIPFAGTYEKKNGLGVEKLFDAQYPGIYFSKVGDVYVQSVTLNNEKNPYKIYCDVSNGLNTTKSISVDNTTIKLNDQGQLTLALSNANEVSF